LLCFECIAGLLVAISNILVILTLIMGGNKIMKNHFYIVLTNLVVFTTLKGFVELAFILPFYVQQNNVAKPPYVYVHKCANIEGMLMILFNCLIYLSYACAAAVLFIQQRIRDPKSAASLSQMQLLKQSFLVFALYAASIGIVFAIPYIPMNILNNFYLAYAENLFNLSIAAVYPLCFLAMSGEMR
ncbi:hypothetical protein PENTCL1PPCAC_14528, partial [Pristionchus entomophagus]